MTLPLKEVLLPPRPALTGAVVCGTYRIDGLHTRTKTSQLYQAQHLRLTQRVLIKALDRQHVDDALARARFIRETTSLSRIDSPHVIRILDVGELPDGRPCLVMPWLRGTDLHSFMRARRVVEPLTALRICIDVAVGLRAAHRIGVIHRDVKPANIVLVDDNDHEGLRACLVDFGVAASNHDTQARITQPGAVVGTPSYMPPEQAFGAAADARSDVYALGAVLYRLLTGRPPYAGTDPTQVLKQVRASRPRRAGSLLVDGDPILLSIIEQAMARQPSERFDTIEQMLPELRHAYRVLSQVQARPPASQADRGRVTAGWFCAGAAVGLALAAAAMAFG